MPPTRRDMEVAIAEKLPDFVVIGAQKAGTTSLYNYLCAHPQIFLPRKELDFFCYAPALPHVDRYRAQFEAAGEGVNWRCLAQLLDVSAVRLRA